jgi:ketosteroid isomerase-like protein
LGVALKWAININLRLEWAMNINLRKVLMSDSSQVALIRKLYDAMGDVNSFKSLLADDVEWDIAEGFPNGGVYRGIDTVVSDFFTFFADFDEFYAKGDEYFESGDHGIVLGRYFGVTKKGQRVQARFAHFWTLRDGKIVRLQQTADTHLIARALGK